MIAVVQKTLSHTIKLAFVLNGIATEPQHCRSCQQNPPPVLPAVESIDIERLACDHTIQLAAADGGGTFAGQSRCRNAERLGIFE
jgi:hypothetical protein